MSGAEELKQFLIGLSEEVASVGSDPMKAIQAVDHITAATQALSSEPVVVALSSERGWTVGEMARWIYDVAGLATVAKRAAFGETKIILDGLASRL